MSNRIGFRERFGLIPFGPAMADARRAIAGNPHMPGVDWDFSSTRIFKPEISIPTWLGWTLRDGTVPIYNFVNRNPAPQGTPFSVKVSFARDFQGNQWTYDSHLGTDFAVPIGTTIVAAAPGVVLRVANEIDRGGLKVCIDHGEGLFTTSSHMSRVSVTVGDRVGRGQVIGQSGVSGIEFLLFFPWVAPHLHLNVWLNGDPIDPFAMAGETSMWRHENTPKPHRGAASETFPKPSLWDEAGVDAAVRACRDPEMRESMSAIRALPRRAAEVLFMRNLRAAAFDDFPPLYKETGSRRPCLDLPFGCFEGASFPSDGFGWSRWSRQ